MIRKGELSVWSPFTFVIHSRHYIILLTRGQPLHQRIDQRLTLQRRVGYTAFCSWSRSERNWTASKTINYFPGHSLQHKVTASQCAKKLHFPFIVLDANNPKYCTQNIGVNVYRIVTQIGCEYNRYKVHSNWHN